MLDLFNILREAISAAPGRRGINRGELTGDIEVENIILTDSIVD